MRCGAAEPLSAGLDAFLERVAPAELNRARQALFYGLTRLVVDDLDSLEESGRTAGEHTFPYGVLHPRVIQDFR